MSRFRISSNVGRLCRHGAAGECESRLSGGSERLLARQNHSVFSACDKCANFILFSNQSMTTATRQSYELRAKVRTKQQQERHDTRAVVVNN